MKQTKAQYHYAVRRCKRASKELGNDKLVEALLNGDKDLFETVKKNRIRSKEVATIVDGQKGANYISKHFRNQYEVLYNQQNSKIVMEEVLDTIDHDIEPKEVKEVNRITPDLVKDILN